MLPYPGPVLSLFLNVVPAQALDLPEAAAPTQDVQVKCQGYLLITCEFRENSET